MDKNQFWKIKEQLKPNEALMVFGDNTIRLMWRNNEDKKCYKPFGKLEEFPETIIPAKSKPWATPPQKGKKSFFKFGQILPKYDKTNEEDSKKIQKWTMAFNALKALDFTPKKSKWTDTFMRLSYDVETLNGISVYYYENTPRYIEFEGEKLIIAQLKPELKIEKFNSLDDVK